MVPLRQAQRFQRPEPLLAVQNSRCQVFAVQRGNNVDAEIDSPPFAIEDPTPLLRTAALGNVDAGLSFEIGNQMAALLSARNVNSERAIATTCGLMS